ncbi:MAG: nucleoside-triphosphatase [Marinilabiliales bacterium]|nr:nucleoside-triphosphatase [Marinilabiliales bacterium]
MIIVDEIGPLELKDLGWSEGLSRAIERYQMRY